MLLFHLSLQLADDKGFIVSLNGLSSLGGESTTLSHCPLVS